MARFGRLPHAGHSLAPGLEFLRGHGADADFAYETVAVPGIVVTGVRSDSAVTDAVVVTASDVTGSTTSAALYQGSLQDLASAPESLWNALTPVFPGQTVTSSTFYGPNTPSFDPASAPGRSAPSAATNMPRAHRGRTPTTA